jgi:hypothetical protein
MTKIARLRTAGRGLACGAGLAAGAYAAYAGTTWLRYGRVQPSVGDDQDPVLDRFMPAYEIVERHHLTVAAPADITFAAACDLDLQQSAAIRAIFRGRELMMRSRPDPSHHPRGILALTKSLGWGVLAEVPGREIVVGAVTQPWNANVVFRSLPPAAFAAFHEPDYVKIAWTLRADATGAVESVARTETRVMTTDAGARRKFRRYWSLVSPGIVVIRRVALGLVRAEAERRAAGSIATSRDRFDLVSAGDLDPQC